MSRFTGITLGTLLSVVWGTFCQQLVADDTNRWPDFEKVLGLIQTNLPGITRDELNHAVIEGLQKRLDWRFQFVPSSRQSGKMSDPGVVQTNLFDEHYGYFRVCRIDADLPDRLGQVLQDLQDRHQLNGIVLDLRYTDGNDYGAVSRVADLFLSEEKTLFTVENQEFRSTAKTNHWRQSLAVLVNSQTSEAAEILAGILRQENVALLLGLPTAGRAQVFKAFPLNDEQQIRLAIGTIRLTGNRDVPAQALKPDILVSVRPEEERAFYEDAYRMIASPRILSEVALGSTNRSGLSSTNNRSSRRINEAELVRRQREGQLTEDETVLESAAPLDPVKPALTDPTLARALDLLKGLTVVQKNRPASFRR
ncbi:MAG TPA: S41 family peptidase [Candidatus Paceibacterota bacterium]|nr:S41 family peptidase [Verrucomicrobiota bacterium]HRY47199.1 S41 family peptidase [Candidatus Paceibacterota bacterium]HSA01204.1 S41 family peptidase [Candidatus Paceibacterota bacterium]